MKNKKHHKRSRSKSSDISTMDIPTETMENRISISTEEIKACPYFRGNQCTRRNDGCNPNSFKCYRYKSDNPVMYSGYISTPTNTSSVRRERLPYDVYKSERYGYNKEIKTLNTDGKIVILNIFKGFLNLARENIIDYKVVVKNIKDGRERSVLVAYNQKTGRYYMSKTQLKWLHKQSFCPAVRFHSSNDGSIPLITAEFQEFSELALYGYSAGKNGLCKKDRQKILKYVLDNEAMFGFEIIRHLQWLIHNGECSDRDFSAAIKDWEDDIIFVNQYVQDNKLLGYHMAL